MDSITICRYYLKMKVIVNLKKKKRKIVGWLSDQKQNCQIYAREWNL